MLHALPATIDTPQQLDDLLSDPTPAVLDTLSRLDGDLMILGVGGKMGPTLARMAVRAVQASGVRRRILAVARFSEAGLEERLRGLGIETIRCDLMQPGSLESLPDAANIVSMTAFKFGASNQTAAAWSVNTFLSGLIARRFAGSRIAAFSTGNVYPMTPVSLGGSREDDPLGPVGEYAMSCLGRERLYEHFSRTAGTRVSLLRLNYACELRYGVLVDLARRVAAGESIDLSMGSVNVIWQGDANAMALASLPLASSPPFVLNIAGPETLSVRAVCEELGRLLDRSPKFVGAEAGDALLNNGSRGHELFGYPRVPVARLLQWIAHWIRNGGILLDKPTKFEVRTGTF